MNASEIATSGAYQTIASCCVRDIVALGNASEAHKLPRLDNMTPHCARNAEPTMPLVSPSACIWTELSAMRAHLCIREMDSGSDGQAERAREVVEARLRPNEVMLMLDVLISAHVIIDGPLLDLQQVFQSIGRQADKGVKLLARPRQSEARGVIEVGCDCVQHLFWQNLQA